MKVAIENLPPIPIEYIEEFIRISKLCKEDISVLNELIKQWQCDFSIGYLVTRIRKTKEMSDEILGGRNEHSYIKKD